MDTDILEFEQGEYVQFVGDCGLWLIGYIYRKESYVTPQFEDGIRYIVKGHFTKERIRLYGNGDIRKLQMPKIESLIGI